MIPTGGTNNVARVLRMPGVANDAHEGVLSSWLVEETHLFDAAQTIAYVETSTLLLSVEAGRPGVLLKTLVEPGTQVAVGTPIGVIADRDEPIADLEVLLAELGVNGYAAAAEPEPDPEPEPEPEPEPAHRGATAQVTRDHLRTTVRAERLLALALELTGRGVPSTIEHLVRRAVEGADRVVPELHVARGLDGVRREGAADTEPGDSIAISHLGRYGIDDAVLSVVPPQVASLAIGAVRDEPVVERGAIVAGRTLTLTLSVDHDLVDDVLAARWLGVVAALLERPEWMYD